MTKLLEAIRQCRGEAHPAVQVNNRLGAGSWEPVAIAGHHVGGTAILAAE